MVGKFEDNCLFCNISLGKIPAKKIYEDDSVIAILDINPANPGHVLLITKQHFQNILEVPDQLTGYILLLAKAISKVIETSMKVDGINILINHGEAAGQVANHFMLHIIPRFKDDGLNFKWEPKKIEESDLDKILETLKKSPIEVQGHKEKPPEKIETKQEEDKAVDSYLIDNLERVP